MTAYDRYSELRKKKYMNDTDVSRLSGVSRSTFTDWKVGRSEPKLEKLLKIAAALGCQVSDITEGNEIEMDGQKYIKKDSVTIKMPEAYNGNVDIEEDMSDIMALVKSKFQEKIRSIPLFEYVSAGNGVLATGEVIDRIDLPKSFGNVAEYFALRVTGDSMEPRIPDGSIVVVHQQPDAEDGDIVVAVVNGDQGYCKRLRKYQDSICLESLNAAYPPRYFTKEESASAPVVIAFSFVEVRTRI